MIHINRILRKKREIITGLCTIDGVESVKYFV